MYRPRRGLGRPLWVDAADFDLADHVRVRRLDGRAGAENLLQACAHLRRHPLDRSRPLWELWLLPGLSDGRVGMFLRLHHVLADGACPRATRTPRVGTCPALPAVVDGLLSGDGTVGFEAQLLLDLVVPELRARPGLQKLLRLTQRGADRLLKISTRHSTDPAAAGERAPSPRRTASSVPRSPAAGRSGS